MDCKKALNIIKPIILNRNVSDGNEYTYIINYSTIYIIIMCVQWNNEDEKRSRTGTSRIICWIAVGRDSAGVSYYHISMEGGTTH